MNNSVDTQLTQITECPVQRLSSYLSSVGDELGVAQLPKMAEAEATNLVDLLIPAALWAAGSW